MMRKHLAAGIWPLCLLFFSLIPSSGHAQEGDFYVSNYIIEPDRIDNPFFTITQSRNGLIQVANRSGLLQFDGHRWDRIPCPGAVYSIKIIDNTHYVGGKFGYGYIDESEGDKKFISLIESSDGPINIFDIDYKDDFIYFLSNQSVYVYSHSQQKTVTQHHADSLSFVELIDYNQAIYLIHEDGSTAVLDEEQLQPVDSPFPEQVIPVFFEVTNSGKALMGTLDNRLYLSYSNQFFEVPLEDDGYIASNQITSGIWMNDTLAAIGTLKGGVAFIEPAHGTVSQIINSHTGLSDNEVLGLETDRDHGLWVAQSNGLDRVAPYLPVSNFSNYPGLNGKMVSVHPYANSIYVSTTLGVYKLNEVKDYKEIISYIKKTVTTEVPVTRKNRKELERQNRAKESDTEEPQKERGFFSFLRKNKKKDTNKTNNRGLIGRLFKPYDNTISKDSVVIERQVNRELQSIRYMYQRVDGIDSKCSLYENAGDDLIVAGLAGIYLVTGENAVSISEESVRDILYTRDGLLVATLLNGNVHFFQKSAGEWQKIDELTDLEDKPYRIFEDSRGHLLLTATDLVFRLIRKSDKIEIESFALENPYSDRTITLEEGGRVLFINPTGFYTFSETDSSIFAYESLKEQFGTPRKYFTRDDLAWVYNGSTWYQMGRIAANQSAEILELRLLNDLKYVTFDSSSGYFWVIDIEDKLFKISPINNDLSSNYSLFLKDLNNSKVENVSNLKMTENEGSLLFEYVHPDYSGVLGIEYRYQLKGLQDGWSDWNTNNQFLFPYLPAGKYEIIVQSKDIFGQINESKSMPFTILPPYWQRPWFYGLEILLFAGLFGLSIILNRSRKKRYLLLNRLLGFLTLLLMVEFVQAIAEARFGIESSPVFNFFIQVSIAAAVLPVERILRKWLIGDPKKAVSESNPADVESVS